MKESLFDGIQDFFKSAGDEACYTFQIIKLASKIRKVQFDLVRVMLDAIESGLIEFHWDNYSHPNNFLVLDAAAFLSALTGVEWVCEHKPGDYVLKPGEYCINKWGRSYEDKNGKHEVVHFDSDEFHSLVSSKTVREGKIVGKRIFRLKGVRV